MSQAPCNGMAMLPGLCHVISARRWPLARLLVFEPVYSNTQQLHRYQELPLHDNMRPRLGVSPGVAKYGSHKSHMRRRGTYSN